MDSGLRIPAIRSSEKAPMKGTTFNKLMRLFKLAICLLAPLCVRSVSSASTAPPPDSANFCAPIDYGQLRRHHPIPAAKRLAGLNVGESLTVRLIYFLPSDRTPQQDIDTIMNTLIKDVQSSYAEVMEYQGFGKRTFRLETDATGKAVVHHVRGKFNDEYYHKETFRKVIDEETAEQFDLSTNIYFVALDVSTATIDGYCGQGGADGPEGGAVLIPAPNSRLQRERGWSCFNVAVAAHELGHAFGLAHDRFINASRSPSSYHTDWMVTSFCAAEWLDAHRYFNIGRSYPEKDEHTRIQMRVPVAVAPRSVRLHFEMTDPDGLHQAQLHNYSGDAIDCQGSGLDGESGSVEFTTSAVTEAPRNRVSLRVVDVYGNVTEKWYAIDIASLHTPKVVSIPDSGLASVARETLGLTTGDSIVQLDMLRLERLEGTGRQIADLTGLENAVNLTELFLGDNQISDITPLAGLTVLESLQLYRNNISDISSLAKMANLTSLNIAGNSVRDLSPVAELINISSLELGDNRIREITPLANLIHLEILELYGNRISDISPLAELIHLGFLKIPANPLSYSSINGHIPALRSRGVTIEFDPRVPERLEKFSGDGQEGQTGAQLTEPFVVSVSDQNRTAFEGVPVSFAVTTGGGTLSLESSMTDSTGRASSTLTLGSKPGTNTVTVKVSGTDEYQTFVAEALAKADFDRDGTVGFSDFIQFAAAFGLGLGDTGYDTRFDLDGDGAIGFADFLIFAGSFN